MIVIDIETSGLDESKNEIWQIGAIEFENPSNQFLEDAKIEAECMHRILYGKKLLKEFIDESVPNYLIKSSL